MQKLLSAQNFFFFLKEKRFTSYTKHSKLYQMESCIVSRNNTEIRINISFLSESTLIRECVSFFFCVASIFQNWRLSRFFDLEFAFKSFFLFASKLFFLLLNPKRNFDFETKVWDKMPTERETYYLCLSLSTYRSEQTKLCRDLSTAISLWNLYFRFCRRTLASSVQCRMLPRSMNVCAKNAFLRLKLVSQRRRILSCNWLYFSHMIYTNQRRFNGDIGDKMLRFLTMLALDWIIFKIYEALQLLISNISK